MAENYEANNIGGISDNSNDSSVEYNEHVGATPYLYESDASSSSSDNDQRDAAVDDNRLQNTNW